MAKLEDNEKKSEPKTRVSQETLDSPATNHTRNLILIAAGVVVIAVAFLAGMQAADNRHGAGFMSGFGFGPETKMVGSRMRGGYGGNVNTQNRSVLSGKVTAVTGNDFTLDQNGSSKTIKTDSTTRFIGVGISGIKAGDQVVVSGSTNSDGTVQAMRVSVGAVGTNTSSSDTDGPSTTESF